MGLQLPPPPPPPPPPPLTPGAAGAQRASKALPDVVSIDCDLRKLYAWSDADGMLCNGSPTLDPIIEHTRLRPCTVLFEIASAVNYRKRGESTINTNRWRIWNIAAAMRLWMELRPLPDVHMLVAPSSDWTMGYEEKQRAQIARANAKNHHLREAQCMLWFWKSRPDSWIPLELFLQNL